jgi:membrane protein YqaA with SNARE-associated domain
VGSVALRIEQFLLALTGPWAPFCLALIAAADSSFLSLIEVNDLLIVVLTVKHPENMLLYCAFTTVGSVAGCWLMFRLGQKGGEVFLTRRFAESQIRKVGDWQKKYGFLTLVASSILPPPTPFKLVVLTAGALKTPLRSFLFSMVLGRSCRYFTAGVLALLYGEMAWTYLQQHYFRGAFLAVGVILAGVIIFMLARNSRFFHPTGN